MINFPSSSETIFLSNFKGLGRWAPVVSISSSSLVHSVFVFSNFRLIQRNKEFKLLLALSISGIQKLRRSGDFRRIASA